MNKADEDNLEMRSLILAPIGRDALLICSMLSNVGIECVICPDMNRLRRELDIAAGVVIVTEEALRDGAPEEFVDFVARQPTWSDLPILILTQAGADSIVVRRALDALGNVTLVERPTRAFALLSVVRTALRARQRQYQIRSHQKSLREANRRKDEFVATLAHELRNPLAPIQYAVKFLLNVDNPVRSDLRQVGELIGRQAQQLKQLIDDLLDISRITRGEIVLRKERVELSAVVHDAIETARPLLEAAEHELYVTQLSGPLFVDADPIRLGQSLSNLLSNAAKYTPARGRIFLNVWREAGRVILQVRDTGIGIAAENLPHIFEMFVQVDRSLERSGGGLGIGLWLVKRIAEMHGGVAEANSVGLGQGSEFTLRLPIVAEQQPLKAPRPVTAGDPGEDAVSGHRILVVDDNRDSAESLSKVLAMAGNEVQTAYDGLQAIQTVSRFHPDIALLDIGLPKMNGYEAARRIRKQPGGEDIVLIAVSGWGQEEDKRRSAEAGFDYHFVKPMDVFALDKVLASAKKHEWRSQRRGA